MSKLSRHCVIFPALGSPMYGEILGPGENPDHVTVRLGSRELEWPEDQLNEYETAEQAAARLRDLRKADRAAWRHE